MSDSKKFISDIFGTDNPDTDIRQKLVYNYVKSYPSINSSNNGHIHSEENVRWLSKQFTKKPFIIQYDDNNMDEFHYEGASLNAGITNGGMVNIDGYIINTASDMTKLSFDNTEDTKMGTDDGGYNLGYIGHQTLQRDIQQFIQGINNSDIGTIIPIIQPDLSIDYYIHNLSEQYLGLTTEDCWDYLRYCFSTIYKKNNHESILSEVYYVGDLEIPVDYDAGISCGGTDSAGLYGKIIITYTDEVLDYIHNYMDISKFSDKYTITEGIRDGKEYMDIEYPVFYGIANNYSKPVRMVNNLDTYDSSLFLEDIFGFYYLFNINLSLGTNTFPSNFCTDINFVEDTITPTDPNVLTTPGIIRTNNKIYDLSNLYETITISQNLQPDLYDAVIAAGMENQTFYAKSNSIQNLPTPYNAVDILNDTHFKLTSSTNVINWYKTLNNVDDTAINDQLNSGGHLDKLCDLYYCLPLSDEILRVFGVRQPDSNSYIPVGIITSSGALMIRNYERRFSETAHERHPEWQYQTSYVDIDTNENVYQQIYVEGYMSFFRRVCALLYNIDITNTLGPYGNISNLNDLGCEGWRKIFKDIQYGVLTIDISGSPTVIDNLSDVTNFFAVSDVHDITFEILYNKLLAPYVNMYTQLAWSQLFLNTTRNTNNNYKAIKAYTVIKEMAIPGAKDNISSITIPVTHNYTNGYSGQKTITYGLNTYTDYQRLDKFLCSTNITEVPSGINTRTKIDIESMADSQCASICQDYIDYIKGCARFIWTDTNFSGNVREQDLGYIQIPFKITTLETTTNSYDNFTVLNGVVDKFANYTKGINNSQTCEITPGYIQNVTISTYTLLPIDSVTDNNYTLYMTQEPAPTNLQENPLNQGSYELKLNTHTNIDYDGSQTRGVSGYNFVGNSQGWVVAVPTMFRLYKDSQNELNGRLRGTVDHAGIFIDYKLPYLVEEKDFWFANTWLSSIRGVIIYDIESSGASYPNTIDGMSQYLRLRNHTIFSTEDIYSKDSEGNYISLNTYIQQFLSDEEPMLKYVDWKNDNTYGKVCIEQVYRGLQNNVKRLKSYVDDSMFTTEYNYVSGDTGTLIRTTVKPTAHPSLSYYYYIKNNTYHNIKTTGIEDGILNILIKHTFLPTDNINEYTLNTTNIPNTNSVFKSTLKFEFIERLKLSLNTIFNQFGTTPSLEGIPTSWSSNYPVTTEVDSEGITHYNMELVNYINPKQVNTALVELTAYLSEDKKSAIGYCQISMIADNQTLTSMDMNYLWKELYKLDRIPWNQVSVITKTGCAPKMWNIGDTKTFNVTYAGTTYPIQAMIIGFDEDINRCYPKSSHTVTWMTNIYNNSDLDVSSVALFNKTFPADLRNTSTNGQLGYNHYTSGQPDLDIVKWMNYNQQDLEAEGIGIYAYTDPELIQVTAQSVTTTGLVYTCNKNTDYKLLVHNYEDTHPITGHRGLTFWLPSLSQLGLSFLQDDPIESELNVDDSVTRELFTLNEPYPNISSSDDVNFRIVESSKDPQSLAYSYFKQDTSVQNVKPLMMLTSSYYTINLNLDTLPTPPASVDDYVYNNTDFTNIPRTMYAVGAGYDDNTTKGRWFTILHREEVLSVLNNELHTDFCFITI